MYGGHQLVSPTTILAFLRHELFQYPEILEFRKKSVMLKILEVKHSTEISNTTTPIVTQPFIEQRIKSLL